MRIVFFGTGSFAVPTLKAVARDVVLVVTQPDRPSGRGFKLKPSEVKLAAEELGLPVAAPEKARDIEFVEQVSSLFPDALFVASYGQILPQRLLDAAKRGGINFHGSLLPRYRGAAPIQRSILYGDMETGVTLMQMDKGMDTGGIIGVSKTRIGTDETYGELQDRLADIAAKMAISWIPKISLGTYRPEPQDSSRATVAPKVDKSEAELVCSRNADEEYNRFRAFTPAPGAFLQTNVGIVKVSTARKRADRGVPGTILNRGEGCLVAFEGGSIDLLEVQPEGKRRMMGRDFMNGFRLRPGASLR